MDAAGTPQHDYQSAGNDLYPVVQHTQPFFCSGTGTYSAGRRRGPNICKRNIPDRHYRLCGSVNSWDWTGSACALGKSLEIFHLGDGTGIYFAIVLLRAAGIIAGQPACGDGGGFIVRYPPCAEPVVDRAEFYRRFVVLRNVSPLSQHISFGIGACRVGAHHCCEFSQSLAASHAGWAGLFVVSSMNSRNSQPVLTTATSEERNAWLYRVT